MNPVEARLVEDSVLYGWMEFPNIKFPQGLKPQGVAVDHVRAEARTLHPNEHWSFNGSTAEAAPFQSSSVSAFQSNGESPARSNGDSSIGTPIQTSKGE